jgi:signal peptidase
MMTSAADGQSQITGVLWWLVRVAAWTTILGITAVIAVSVLVPRLGGGTPYAILTASMQPDLPPGSLVVVRPVAAEDVSVGSVITYQLVSGEPTVVTHRVVGVGVNAKGERTFTTQGDANNVVDDKPVRPAQIQGELWYSVPHLGFVNRYVSGEQRHLTTMIVVVVLLGYAGTMVVGGLRDRRRSPGPRGQRAVLS